MKYRHGVSKTTHKIKPTIFMRFLTAIICLVVFFYTRLLLSLYVDQRTETSSTQQTEKWTSHFGKEKKNNEQSNNNKTSSTATVVAYAISLIKCGDLQSNDAGMVDAALVLRHSIHKISARDPNSGSNYDYHMYAIVHKQAEQCSYILKNAGFDVIIIQQSPIQPKEIQGAYLRENIETEWCCGSDEFIKLYAYTLPEPIIVHTDIDFVFLRPMDDLFDAILFPKESPRGSLARSKIPMERPEDGFPDQIDAFITRDWPQIIPGRKALYQAGFLVARRRPETLSEAIEVVREGNYVDGYGKKNGWGGAGYGAFVGGKQNLYTYPYCTHGY